MKQGLALLSRKCCDPHHTALKLERAHVRPPELLSWKARLPLVTEMRHVSDERREIFTILAAMLSLGAAAKTPQPAPCTSLVACCARVASERCCCGKRSREAFAAHRAADAIMTGRGNCDCPMFSVFGVNHALHLRRNQGFKLNGILKGCAEQNALGAVAAQGVPFHCVREVLLMGVRVKPSASPGEAAAAKYNVAASTTRTGRLHAHNRDGDCTAKEKPDLLLPCEVCWKHIDSVKSEVQRVSGCRLHVLVAEHEQQGGSPTSVGVDLSMRVLLSDSV